MSTQRRVDRRQAELIHDHLVRLLNLDPSQVRAGAFSVTWSDDADDHVDVTWDGGGVLSSEQWNTIVRAVGL